MFTRGTEGTNTLWLQDVSKSSEEDSGKLTFLHNFLCFLLGL
jgi:hypothetical protein